MVGFLWSNKKRDDDIDSQWIAELDVFWRRSLTITIMKSSIKYDHCMSVSMDKNEENEKCPQTCTIRVYMETSSGILFHFLYFCLFYFVRNIVQNMGRMGQF